MEEAAEGERGGRKWMKVRMRVEVEVSGVWNSQGTKERGETVTGQPLRCYDRRTEDGGRSMLA